MHKKKQPPRCTTRTAKKPSRSRLTISVSQLREICKPFAKFGCVALVILSMMAIDAIARGCIRALAVLAAAPFLLNFMLWPWVPSDTEKGDQDESTFY